MIYENNEEKRSTLWRTVLTVSSVIIVIIAEVILNETEGENGEGSVPMTYTVDTKTKIFTVYTDSAHAEGVLSGSYDYNIVGDTLTLTEREYGDQIVFERE